MKTAYDTNATNASVTAELAIAAQRGEQFTIGERHLLVTPNSHGGVDIAEVLARDAHGNLTTPPSRRVGAVTVQTQDSLVAYLNDFKGPGSRMFADISANAIVAVLDYHQGRTDALTGEVGSTTTALLDGGNHGQHVASLKLPFSEEWKVWTKADGEMMAQTDFARFIIENQPDFLSPDHATLLEVAKDLRAARNVKFTAEVNINAENESFEYVDRTDTNRTGGLEVPSSFTIRIPVYFGGRAVEVQAQLRHGVDPETGRLRLGFKLLRLEQVRQAVFKELVTEVADQSGVPVVYGSTVTRSPDSTGAKAAI